MARPVHAALPGRTRFEVDGLYQNRLLKGDLERRLRMRNGIRSVQASELTGRVLVHYEDEVSLEQVQGWIADAVRNNGQALEPALFGWLTNGDTTGSTTAASHALGLQEDAAAFAVPRAASGGPLVSWAGRGLDAAEIPALLERFGPNRLPGDEPRSALSILAEQFYSLPVGLLAASACLSIATGGLLEAAAIAGVVLINACIGYATESESERTINALARGERPPAMVLRSGRLQEIPAEQVVPGDILELRPGTAVAAEALLITAERLTVDESALTGESQPVAKRAPASMAGVERETTVFMGTTVAGGSGRAIVVATGAQTQLGQISALIGQEVSPETPLQRKLGDLGRRLVWVCAGICGLVFALGLLRGQPLLAMARSSISLAIAAVPEGLPAVATTTLALGIGSMRRQNVLIRRLPAVEALGAVQVMCFDKTGTITLNEMSASEIYVAGRSISTAGDCRSCRVPCNGELPGRELGRLFAVATLCSEAEVEASGAERGVNGSPTEAALVRLAMRCGIDVEGIRARHPTLTIEHRAERQNYMATTHPWQGEQRLVAIKGSPRQVLALCGWIQEGSRRRRLTGQDREAIIAANEDMAGRALRVLGMAFAIKREDGRADRRNLTWLGLVGMADPVRPGADRLMKAFQRAGIRTVMVTGDQPTTARAVARQLGLNGAAPIEVVEEETLLKATPEELPALVRRATVFARISPSHKLELVRAFQRAGNVTAMTGDGINDGPALKAADIGVAMGRGGTDVARQVAGVVLEDDDLHSMLEAVRQGRTVHGNIRRSIRFILATNLSEIMVMLGAIAAGAGQPLQPLQLLWINLLSDVFPCLALAVEPPEPDVLARPPRDPDAAVIDRAAFPKLVREAGLLSASTLAGYGYGLWRYGPGAQASTIAFTTLVSGQLLHGWTCRSERHGLLTPGRRPPNRYLDAAILGSLALQVVAAFMPGLRRLLGTAPIGLLDGAVVGAGAVAPFLVNELMKVRDIRTQQDLLVSQREFGRLENGADDGGGRTVQDTLGNLLGDDPWQAFRRPL